jgi:hypothetical protein
VRFGGPSKDGNYVGTVSGLGTKCYSDGFGVLIELENWRFQYAEEPARRGTARRIVGKWVEALLAENHNPRTSGRSLFVTAIAHHRTSVTGVEHFAQVARSKYRPGSDEIATDEVEFDHASKKAPSDFW